MSKPQLLVDFLDHNYINNNAKENTLKNYECQLNLFFKWLKENKIIKKVIEYEIVKLTEKDIEDYIKYCKKSFSSNTVDSKVTILKSFFGYLVELNKMSYNIVKIKSNRKRNGNVETIEYLVEDQVEKLLDECLKDDSEFKERNYAILLTFLNTGMRKSEVINLNIKDIDFIRREIIVKGKKDSVRRININDSLYNSLKEYIDNRDKYYITIKDDKALFLNKHGERLKATGMDMLIKKYGQRSGIEIHPHMLRHTVATTMVEQDVDIRVIQEVLGHADISTTTIYAGVTSAKRKQAMNQINFGNKGVF